MFPASDADWIEEPLTQNVKNNLFDIKNNNIIELKKIFYHMDSEDMAFRMKLDCLIIKDTSNIAENKTWGINVNDSDTKNLLFILQLKDTMDKCTIELFDEKKTKKVSVEGKISDPSQNEDNIKITMIPSEVSDKENGNPVNVISFYLDFKFSNKLLYEHLPNLIGKAFNCNLTHFILSDAT
jgi:hypothetical protein